MLTSEDTNVLINLLESIAHNLKNQTTNGYSTDLAIDDITSIQETLAKTINPDSPKNWVIPISLEEDGYKRLKVLASDQGETVSQTIARWIKQA